jgi:hypothetical protein
MQMDALLHGNTALQRLSAALGQGLAIETIFWSIYGAKKQVNKCP